MSRKRSLTDDESSSSSVKKLRTDGINPLTAIDRSNLFYGNPDEKSFGKPISLFPKECGSSKDTRTLAKRIFPEEFRNEKDTRLPKRLRTVGPLLQTVAKKHNSERPIAALLATCQLPKSDATIADMSNTHNAVAAFATTQLKRVFPDEFWGSQHNFRVVARAVRRLVTLRRRETLRLQDICKNFKITHCNWLAPRSQNARPAPSDMEKRKALLLQFFNWLFSGYLIPCLKSTFYVTEHSQYKNQVFYFRHDIWRKITKPFFDNLTIQRYHSVDQRFLASLRLGSSPVRLIPKANGFRVITSMNSTILHTRSGPSTKRGNSNWTLAELMQVLKLEMSEQPEMVGGAVTNMQEMLEKFAGYKKTNLRNGNRKFYLVKADIKNCFDTIDQTILLDILRTVLREENYTLLKYNTTINAPNRKISRQEIVVVKGHSKTMTAEEASAYLAERSIYTASTDDITYKCKDASSLIALAEEHITKNTVKIGNKFYRQTVGIPQGSCLSNILCSLFYGRMEKEELKFLKEDPDAMLIRYVDDFFLISTRKETITKFCNVIARGVPKYNCFFNKEKSMANFETGVKGIPFSDCREFAWCGLVINTENLDIHYDYSRYLSGRISDGVTAEYSSHAGRDMLHKAIQSIKTRIQSGLMDPQFNSKNAVYRNFYECFLCTAIKFAAHCRELQRKGHQNSLNQKYIFDIVMQLADMIEVELPRGLSKKSVMWYFFKAFHQTLRRRHNLFSNVTACLERCLDGYGPCKRLEEMRRAWPETRLSEVPW